MVLYNMSKSALIEKLEPYLDDVLLKEVREALALGVGDKTRLGIGQAAYYRRNWLYIEYNDVNGQVSHFYQGLGKAGKDKQLFFETDIVGYIRHVMLYLQKDNTQDVPKLKIFLEADKNYIIGSGLETQFSLGFLTSLLQLEPSRLEEPIIILLSNNKANPTSRNLVFCSLEQHGKQVYAPRTGESGMAMLEQVQEKFGFSKKVGRSES